MIRAFPALALALAASGILLPSIAGARDGSILADRWTFVRSFTDSQDRTKTHQQFRKETFVLGTNGTQTLKDDHGVFDYVLGGADDDSYAVTQRQNAAGRFVIVEYTLDTDPDKASFRKTAAAFKLDLTSDPYAWVTVDSGTSSAGSSLESAWSSLVSVYQQNTGTSNLGGNLIVWLFNTFAKLSYSDQISFATRAAQFGLTGTQLREIEAALRSSGFPVDLSTLLPAGGVDLALTSIPTIALGTGTVSIGGVNIQNNRTSSSGPIQLDLYAFRAPYRGGPLPPNTYPLASVTLTDPLAAGARITNASFDRALLTTLPEATYYLALVLSDASGRRDHIALGGSVQIGPLVGVSPGEQNMPTQLINLSTRLRVEAGDNVAIGGFVVSGTGSKRVIIRALGPSLTARGVTGTLSAVSMELRNAAGALVAQNSGWTSDQQAEIQATGLPPGDPREAAIVTTLSAGAYTVIVRGVGGEMGVALIEMYDLQRDSTAIRPINVSTRGRVLTGDSVMIGGFVIGGNRTRRVMVRAVGPSLTQSGVSGVLQNPTLELRDRAGALMAQNDDWTTSDQSAAIAASPYKPKSDQESAIIMTLAPGPYTAIVRGVNGSTGVALVEVFDLE